MAKKIKAPTGISGFFFRMNHNVYIVGIAMIILNLGSKYIVNDLTFIQNKILASSVMKILTLFSLVFIATHSIQVSFLITGVYYIFMKVLLNENSSLCILPKSMKRIDTNYDGKISESELRSACQRLQEKDSLKSESQDSQPSVIF